MSEWKEYKLGDLAEVQTGPFGSQLHQRDYKLVGTPIITVEHLGENKIIPENLPLVGEMFFPLENCPDIRLKIAHQNI